MKHYIGTKIVQAELAFRCTDNQMRVDIIVDPDEAATYYKSKEGYRIRYPDGYESWSPKETFEKAYLPLNINGELGTSAPSIGAKMVDDFILETYTETMGEKTTVVRAVLKNGFEIVESSSCVSPENYDVAVGREICLDKIKNKIWMLLGFLLQTAVNGCGGKPTERR